MYHKLWHKVWHKWNESRFETQYHQVGNVLYAQALTNWSNWLTLVLLSTIRKNRFHTDTQVVCSGLHMLSSPNSFMETKQSGDVCSSPLPGFRFGRDMWYEYCVPLARVKHVSKRQLWVSAVSLKANWRLLWRVWNGVVLAAKVTLRMVDLSRITYT